MTSQSRKIVIIGGGVAHRHSGTPDPPDAGFKSLPLTLPGLKQFLRAGQWVQAGGGLPTGLMTARAAIQAMCRQDHVLFSVLKSWWGGKAG